MRSSTIGFKPDTLDQKELKQLVLYLKHTADYVQEMKQSFAMASAMGERSDDVKMAATQHPSLLEVFADSDWASGRTTRRSMSRSHMYLNGIFFWSASRSPSSSCEAEFISAVSGMADGIYIKRMLEAVLNMKVVLDLGAED